MNNPLDNLNLLPSDVRALIGHRLPFDKLGVFFAKQPQFKDNIQFWKGKLNYEIEEASKKWPKLYLFDYSQNQQDLFFDKVYENNKDLVNTFLACLFIFDICIKENKEYWDKKNLGLWHIKRKLSSPVKVNEFLLMESNLPSDIFFKNVGNIEAELKIFAFLKYGDGEWLNKLMEKEAIKIVDSIKPKIVAKVLDDIKPGLINKVAEKLKIDFKNKTIKKIEKGKSDYFTKDFLYYLTEKGKESSNRCQGSWFSVLRQIRGPLLSPLKEINLNISDINASTCNQDYDVFIYFLIEQDNVELVGNILNKVSKNNKSEIIIDLLFSCLPKSKLYSYLLPLFVENKLSIGDGILISNFQIFYSLFSDEIKPNSEIQTTQKTGELVKLFYPNLLCRNLKLSRYQPCGPCDSESGCSCSCSSSSDDSSNDSDSCICD